MTFNTATILKLDGWSYDGNFELSKFDLIKFTVFDKSDMLKLSGTIRLNALMEWP